MKLLYIDLFCGAGGTSTGVNLARVDGQDCARVIACVNHDEKPSHHTQATTRMLCTSPRTSAH